MDGEDDAWFDRELAGCSFVDERLNKRLRKLVAQIGSAMGQGIPLVCQDWANTKAAYRFFSNDRVSEADILAGHFQSTFERAVATDGPVFVLHDTTEFSFQREDTEAMGITKSIKSGERKPVALPPGRAKLAAQPSATGSVDPTTTMGRVEVALIAASRASGPAATMTSTRRRTRSAARAGGKKTLDPEEVQGDRRAQEED
jgi:hypothetical protein